MNVKYMNCSAFAAEKIIKQNIIDSLFQFLKFYLQFQVVLSQIR